MTVGILENPLLNDQILRLLSKFFEQIYKKFTTPTKEFYSQKA